VNQPEDIRSRFTERAKTALQLAEQEARNLGHAYVDPGHLLLGLLAEGQGIAARVLRYLSIDLQKAQDTMVFIIGRGEQPTTGNLPWVPRLQKVIRHAAQEADLLQKHFIGTEHLLLGLTTEHQGMAAALLEATGIQLEQVRKETLAFIGSGQPVVPEEAKTLVKEDQPAKVCERCGLRSPDYFQYCFWCGLKLS
jgi:ATP-dependent Clp protease ATP-binding subunit ClpC